ncbi:MAG: hypothetical protein ACXVAZ_07650 [Mucilaginibacter sp.]
MEADKNDINILNDAIQNWEHEGKLTPLQAAELRNSITVRENDNSLIAQYFFIIALSCTLLAFAAIFIDDKLLEKIKVYFSVSDAVIAFITGLLSASWFFFVGKNKNKFSPARFETYMILGGVSALTCMVYICKGLTPVRSYEVLFLVAAALLFVLSILFRSTTLWIGAVMNITAWFEEYSSLHSTRYRFMGMNYPVRFAIFGLLIVLFAAMQSRISRLRYSQQFSFVMGLLLFFTSMWLVSIFGNYNYLDEWYRVRQTQVLAYGIVLGIVALLTFYLGIKFRNDTARDIGFIFLLLDLYTRYFEYFWDSMNKGLFFLILAITFWLLGALIRKGRKIIH